MSKAGPLYVGEALLSHVQIGGYPAIAIRYVPDVSTVVAGGDANSVSDRGRVMRW
jgi:hypothetical protein